MMKSLAKIVFGFIIAKCSLIGVWKASSYASNIPANFYLLKVNYTWDFSIWSENRFMLRMTIIILTFSSNIFL